MAKDTKKRPQVLIIVGSDSDLPVISETEKILNQLGISYLTTISSAHRSPARTRRCVKEAEENGVKVIIAAAGGAAHLPGVIAAETILPVIGIPINSSPLMGIDSLLSIVQMPSGVPVATMAIDRTGAKNAAVFAAQILALGSTEIEKGLQKYKEGLSRDVEEKAKRLHGKDNKS
jgi:5-(carboxyamino)imidazole ribonucleotide mutase